MLNIQCPELKFHVSSQGVSGFFDDEKTINLLLIFGLELAAVCTS